MSTKTTFKRVALVAVAALGLGVLTSVAPASAAAPTYATSAYATTPATVAPATSVLAATAATSIAGPANYVSINNAGALSQYITVTGGAFTDATVAKTVIAGGTVYVSTPTVGTITVTITEIAVNGVADVANAATLTITVLSALSGTVYASTTVSETVAGAAADAIKYTNAATGDVTRLGRAAATGALYSFALSQVDASAVPAALTAPFTKAVTATLSGVGSLAMSTGALPGTPTAPYVAAAAQAANTQTVGVYADGRAGTSVLTISVNGVVVKTYNFKFWGSVASYDPTVNNAYLQAANNYGGAYVEAVDVAALDANGLAVPGATVHVRSSSTEVVPTTPATAGVAPSNTLVSSSLYTCNGIVGVTGADCFAALGVAAVDLATSATSVAGTVATLTFANASTTALTTISKTASVTVSGAQIADLSWAFDSASYLSSQKAKITFTALDANKMPVGDGTYTIFAAAPTANLAVTGAAPWSASITTSSGVATWTLYAPIISYGTLTVSGKLATNASLATALQGVAVSKSAEIGDTAAVDAAAEATDAANAATDAANAAAEAADAATAAAQDAADAVAALSAQVATLIGALKAQLTALTNLVIKIQKKVKA